MKVVINYGPGGHPDINIKGAPIGTLVCYSLIALVNLAIVSHMLEKSPTIWQSLPSPFWPPPPWGQPPGGLRLLSRVLPEGYAGAALATLGAICAAVAVYAVLVHRPADDHPGGPEAGSQG